MRLDVLKLKINGDFEEFEFCELWEKFEFRGDILFFVEFVYFYGIVIKKGNLIEVSGNVKIKLKIICYRCIDDVYVEVDVFFYEEYFNREDIIDDEVIRFEDDVIEFDDNIVVIIVLYLLMKYLCREDCKGFCFVCGINLNVSLCLCEKDDIDLRLSVLKIFIN